MRRSGKPLHLKPRTITVSFPAGKNYVFDRLNQMVESGVANMSRSEIAVWALENFMNPTDPIILWTSIYNRYVDDLLEGITNESFLETFEYELRGAMGVTGLIVKWGVSRQQLATMFMCAVMTGDMKAQRTDEKVPKSENQLKVNESKPKSVTPTRPTTMTE